MAIMTNGGRVIGVARTGIGASTGGQFDKFQMDATAKYAVGTMVETADGKRFRYAQFDANTNRGVLVAQDFSQVSLPDDDNHVIAPASATSVSFETPKPGALGSTVIQATLTATTNLFLGATLVVTDDTGEGFTYDIIGNTATNTPVTGDIYIFLKQKIQVAVSSDSDVSIVANPWNNLEIATAATDALVSGVTCNTMVVATAPFGWVQTRGLCGVLQDATVPGVGTMVNLSEATSGAVTGMVGGTATGSVADLVNIRCVGYCADAGDSTGHTTVYLQIE